MEEQYNLLNTHFSQAKSVLCVINPRAKIDAIAAAAAFFLAVRDQGKQVQFVTPNFSELEDRTELSPIAGLDALQNDLGNRNLQVAFDYSPEQVDKVNYHIDEENSKFFLTIEPQAGFAPLDPAQVDFSLVGTDADMIVLFGVQDFESLEQLYFGYEQVFQDSTVVAINSFASAIGDVKLDYGHKAAICEGVLELFAQLQIGVSHDVATNLLYGINAATSNFSSLTTSAETFEAVAQLLRLGARRLKVPTAASQPNSSDGLVSSPKPIVSNLSAGGGSSSDFAAAMSRKGAVQPSEDGVGKSDLPVRPNHQPQPLPKKSKKKKSKKASQTNGSATNGSANSNPASSEESPQKPGSLNYQPGEGSQLP